MLRWLLVATLAATACGRSKTEPAASAPPVTGLDAVPADASVVISLDFDRLASSPLVERAVAQLLARSPELSSRLDRLATECSLDVGAEVKRVILALGDAKQGEVLLVAVGKIRESDLVRCLGRLVGAGNAQVIPVGDRSGYRVAEGSRTVFLAFGQADTIALSTSEAWLTKALGRGDKVSSAPEMKELLARVSDQSPAWAVGKIAPEVGAGLVGATGGKVQAAPKALFAELDPKDGLRATLGVVLASESDATGLASIASGQLALLALAAQVRQLGPLVAKVTSRADGVVVRLAISLTSQEVREVLEHIDVGSDEEAPPPGPPAKAD